jgi:hypothetical protein
MIPKVSKTPTYDQRQRVPIVVLELCRVDLRKTIRELPAATRLSAGRIAITAMIRSASGSARTREHIVETLDAFEASDKQKIRASVVGRCAGLRESRRDRFGRNTA